MHRSGPARRSLQYGAFIRHAYGFWPRSSELTKPGLHCTCAVTASQLPCLRVLVTRSSELTKPGLHCTCAVSYLT